MKKVIILFNDKDPILTRVSKMKFQSIANWDLVITSSCQEAIDYLNKGGIDVLMTELILNDPSYDSGFDFIKDIRANPNGKDVSIVVLTDLSQDEDKNRAKELGCNFYFVKSEISIQNLIEEMQKIVG